MYDRNARARYALATLALRARNKQQHAPGVPEARLQHEPQGPAMCIKARESARKLQKCLAV